MIQQAIDVDLSDFESQTNFNQSFNGHGQPHNFRLETKPSWIEGWKNLSFSMVVSLILCPVTFFLVGMWYRNACGARSNLPLFLIVFGILILINLFVYTIVGVTFLTLIRDNRLCSMKKGIGLFAATVFSVLFGSILIVWWITGTIWWIKLTLSIQPQLAHPTSTAICHPIVYWTACLANILGLIGFVVQICMAIDSRMTTSK